MLRQENNSESAHYYQLYARMNERFIHFDNKNHTWAVKKHRKQATGDIRCKIMNLMSGFLLRTNLRTTNMKTGMMKKKN